MLVEPKKISLPLGLEMRARNACRDQVMPRKLYLLFAVTRAAFRFDKLSSFFYALFSTVVRSLRLLSKALRPNSSHLNALDPSGIPGFFRHSLLPGPCLVQIHLSSRQGVMSPGSLPLKPGGGGLGRERRCIF